MRYLLIALLLVGCATPEQRAAEMIADYGPFCETMGFQPNTDTWRQCIVNQSNSEMARRAAIYNAFQVGRPRTCNSIGGIVSCY
jgi:hypothetical protein